MDIQTYCLVWHIALRQRLFYVCAYNYIASCKATHIVYLCSMYVYTTILLRVKQHTSSTYVLCMCMQPYYLIYNVQNNTHRLNLFYVCVYNYIASCTTCKTTHIVYICSMYVYTTILPRVQRVK